MSKPSVPAEHSEDGLASRVSRRSLLRGAAAVGAGLAVANLASPIEAKDEDEDKDKDKKVKLEVFAPRKGDVAGVGSRAFVVDLAARFRGDLASTGASPELTGPGGHQNIDPFPGTFGPGANLDHFPGLVVLLSSTRIGAGPGQNVANLFNIVAVTNQTRHETEIWSTWIVGAPNAFGAVRELTRSRLLVAIVAGPAPNVVVDRNGDGVFDEVDLELMGYNVISNARTVDFIVNGF